MSTVADSALREVAQIKREIARSLRSRLKTRGVSVASLARDTGTSRTAIRRVLDPVNTSITLHTLVRTAHSLGYKLELRMEPRIEKVEEIAAPANALPLMDELGDALDRLPHRR